MYTSVGLSELITSVSGDYFIQVAGSRSEHLAPQSSQSGHLKKNMQALKNLALIMGIFILCWVPFLVLNVIEAGDISYALTNELIIKLHKITNIMLLANSVVNPFVYAIRFKSFNVAFRLMCGCLKQSERHTAIEAVTSLWRSHQTLCDHHFADGIFPFIFFNEKRCIWV